MHVRTSRSVYERVATRTPVSINDIYNDTLSVGLVPDDVKQIWMRFILENLFSPSRAGSTRIEKTTLDFTFDKSQILS